MGQSPAKSHTEGWRAETKRQTRPNSSPPPESPKNETINDDEYPPTPERVPAEIRKTISAQDSDRSACATNNIPRKVFTVREVGAILGISRESVFALLRSGQLRSILIGKRGRRVTPTQLDAYLRSLEGQPPDGP